MAMIELSKSEGKQPKPLAEIAKNSAISLSYLEQLIAALRRNDLVKSYRGPGGGYLLNKPAQEILISDILRAAENSTSAKKSAQNNKKSKQNACTHTQDLWAHIGEILHQSLKHISLADVLNSQIKISTLQQQII